MATFMNEEASHKHGGPSLMGIVCLDKEPEESATPVADKFILFQQ